MDLRQITPRFFVAPQIDPEDLQKIADAGFQRVVCNRPDAEVPPSYRSDAMRAAAEAAGLEFYIHPLTHQTMTPEIIAANHALISACEGPVLAYCASGTRSTIAWAIGSAGEMEIDDILAAASAVGYELAHLRPALQSIAET